MNEPGSSPAAPKLSWRFPRTFWVANGAELCERAAYYGMFITLVRYLHSMVGFSDIETGVVTSCFASVIYLLPTFMGIMADKIGFKQALIMAFALLTGGYALLGSFQLKSTALLSLGMIMFGGAIIKPVISGTVAKCSDDDHRVRAMSIFYMVVNIGAFSGKFLAGDLNDRLGLQYINYYASAMAFAALILVAIFYRNVDTKGTEKTLQEALSGLFKVMMHFRFLALILIVAGFWTIQGQLYASMPTYMERILGKGTKPEYLANINPFVVVCCVVWITHLIRHFRPENAIGIGLLIIPFTALVIGLSPALEKITGAEISFGLFSLHPLTVTIIIGVGLQGLAECFLSPKFLEYASKQAPEGEVGLYLGYQHLTTFFAWGFGFLSSGLLLDAYCPDPRNTERLSAEERHEWRLATDPQYRGVLPDSLRAVLQADTVAPPLQQALADFELEIPAGTPLEPEEPGGMWQGEADAMWTFTAQSHQYRIIDSMLKAPGDEAAGRELLLVGDTPRTENRDAPLPAVYARAHWLWYFYAGVGAVAFAMLLIFKFVTRAIDRRHALA